MELESYSTKSCYIHINLLEAGFVTFSEHWNYSSANDYIDGHSTLVALSFFILDLVYAMVPAVGQVYV